MARQTMREKFEELDREKSQRRLVNAAGGVAIGAAGLRLAPFAARGVKRAVPGLARAKSPAVRRVSGAVNRAASPAGSQRFERAANTTGIMSGLLGGTSSFVWGKQIKRNIDEKEKALNVAKANDSWRNYVSEDARAGHAYLRRGERDKKTLASLPMATAAAGAGRAVRGKPLSGLAVVGGSLALGPAARRQWQEGDRWADKARKIRARGEQRRADGAPVSKAIPFRVVRAAKPYPMRPQRAGAMVRRGPRVLYRRGALVR